MPSHPAHQTEDKVGKYFLPGNDMTRLQHFMVVFLKALASMTVKIKHYFISIDKAFSLYTLLLMGQTEENK